MRRSLTLALLATLGLRVLAGGANADAAGTDGWVLNEKIDPMSDQHSTEARLMGVFDGEPVTVLARCSEDSLVFDFVSDSDIAWAADNFLWTRVRLDQQQARLVRTTADHTNEIIVLFSNLPQPVVDRAQEIVKYSNGINQLMNALVGQEYHTDDTMQLDALAKLGYQGYAGSLDEMAATTVMKVELPFANGQKAVVPITLTDSVLRKMIKSCPMYQSAKSH